MSKLDQKEIDARRAEWVKKNPEEAARREAKKHPKSDSPSFERDAMENALDAPLSDQEVQKLKHEMMLLWQSMYNRRHEYLKHRDLSKAVIPEPTRELFKSYIRNYEGKPGFSMECDNLLIEGLKYPEADADLANFCFNYLDNKYSHGVKPSPGLWLQLWSRDFVPLDAVRLMMKHDRESGTYRRVQAFVELFPMLVDKIKAHCEKERQRLNEADDSNSGRRGRRLFFFTVLLHLYGA